MGKLLHLPCVARKDLGQALKRKEAVNLVKEAATIFAGLGEDDRRLGCLLEDCLDLNYSDDFTEQAVLSVGSSTSLS